MKSVGDLDRRWGTLLHRFYPFNQPALAENVLLVVGYVACKSPEIWSETESKGTKGCKSTQAQFKSLETVKKSFHDNRGEIASLVTIFKAWEKVPKRERPRWCRRHHLDNGALAQIEDLVISLKSEVDKVDRRRSLRSAAPTDEGYRNDTQFDSLARLLLTVFPDCLYKKINKPAIYMNMLTAVTKYVFESEEPKYFLHLPNLRRRDPRYFGDNQLSISFVVEEPVADEALLTNKQLLKVANRMEQTSPVPVSVPVMGDAVILKLAGNFLAKSDLFGDLCARCSTPEDLTFVRLIEPEANHPGWKLEVTCPQMYQDKVEAYLVDVVSVAMEELESAADLVPFPEGETSLKLLVGSGGQIQEIESIRHVVVLHLATKNENAASSDAAADVSEEDVKGFFKEFGPIVMVRKSRYFPRSTLWGFIEFEQTSPARKSVQMARGDNLKGFPILNVIYMKGESPLLDVTFHWRKPVIVRNRFQMHFTSEEDVQRLRNHQWPEGVKAEVDDDELKVVLTSEDSTRNLIDMETSLMFTTPVYPKFTTYSHHVIYEANPNDMRKLEAEALRRIRETLPDGDVVEMSAEKPKDGASVLTGKFKSYSFRTLERLEDILGVYNYNSRLCDGEIHLERGVNMLFYIPEEAYKYLEPGLKKIQCDSVRLDGDNDPEDNEGTEEQASEEARRVTRIETKNVWSTGFQVHVYREFYTGQDEKDVKAIAKIMAPHNIKMTGVMMAKLLSKHSYIFDVMRDTNTYIRTMKKDCLLRIYGLECNVSKVKDRIFNDLNPEESEPPRKKRKKSTKVEPPRVWHPAQECPICLCDITVKSYRLSLCGHVYCSDCLRHQVRSTMTTHDFPLRCGSVNCGRTILYQDIVQVCKDSKVEEVRVLQASLQGFLRDNMPHVHPCITPDCQMVYHTNMSKMEGKSTSVKCPLCKVTICTSCHTTFHEGLSCSVYKALAGVESKVRNWMHEDEETRKLCPNCLTGIEKDGGCDHVTCTACKAEICWLCLQFFFDTQKLSYHNCVDNENW